MQKIKIEKYTEYARAMRKEPTPAEASFWGLVRKRQWYGKKFLRQFPIVYQVVLDRKYFFIADFYCHEARLVIELDGEIHEKQKEYDESRTAILNDLGYKVLRFKNEELENFEKVSEKMLACFDAV